MKTISLFAALALLLPQAQAAIEGRDVEYQAGDAPCQGYVALDTSTTALRPGILVVHDWMGVTDHTKDKCKELAQLGFVAFAADIYGKGVRPADKAVAGAEAGKFKGNRTLLRERAKAALVELQKQPGVEKDKIAVIGYCFGGTTALELGRAGADVKGIVSFHGGLDSPTPADGKKIKGKVLVLHGADDPMVKQLDILAFIDELNAAKVDWQMIAYGDAVHAFTQPWVGTDKSTGAAYNEKAARRSWQAMQDFFAEIFK